MNNDLMVQMAKCFDGTSLELFVIESRKFKSLHFHNAFSQSMMDKQAPMRLVVDYTNSIMGFLLFNSSPKKIAMIGLGGGSIAKYCHHYLPTTNFLAIEINAEVIALRNKFDIPEDDKRFAVIEADGATYFKNTDRLFDVIIVDGFDKYGQPAQLCSQSFYESCFRSLETNGILVINFCGQVSHNRRYQDLVNQSFQNSSTMILEKDHLNQVLFACKGNKLTLSIEEIMEQGIELSKKHTFDVTRIAQDILFYRQIDFASAMVEAID